MSKNAFAKPGLPTVLDALDTYEKQDHVTATTKKRVRQDALQMCDWFGMPADQLIASPANLNPRFNRLSRGALKVGKKRISNVRHSMGCVLKCLPAGHGRSFKALLTSEWQHQSDLIADRYRLVSVRCLMQFGSAQNIMPSNFDDDASRRLLAALKDERLNGRPVITHQSAIRACNWLKKNVPGWLVPLLKPARHHEHIILPWSELPAWTKVATERFLERGTTNDPFDLSRPLNAWRPATIKTYETLLRRYFSAMRHAGCDFKSANSLRDVANYDVAEKPLRWLQQAAKRGHGFAMSANTAVLLAQIALNPEQKEKLTEEEKSANKSVSDKLQELASRLRSEPGLSAKVRERLTPLKDEGNLAQLFLLPFALEREVRRAKGRPRQLARLLQWAVVLMLLAFCPLRISTLCSIED